MRKPALPAAIIAASAVLIALNIVFGATTLKRQESRAIELEETAASLRAASGGKGFKAAALADFIGGLPGQSGLTAILDEMFASARECSLELPSADYGAETFKDSSMSRYTFSFPVEGRYGDLKRFLYGLETSARPLVIEEVSLAGAKAGEGRIALRVRVSVYYR